MRRLPLEGVRVADLTMIWAGPYATMRMAEMGAEVLKVESPSAWDNLRTLLPQPGVPDPWNSAYYFNAYNREKKSVTLDLGQERGREIFLRLVERCDVVIENYRADVLDKLGIGYDVLRAARPDAVIVSMAAMGKDGPDRDLVGYGPVVEMMSGLVSRTGYGDGEPYKTGLSYGDPVAGVAAVGAVVLGLIHRRRTGEGCVIDLAQREVAATLAGEAFVAASLRGEVPAHHGARSPRFAPQGCYRAAGDDQWVVVSVTDDDEWAALAAVLGRPDLTGLGLDARRQRHDELDELIAGWTGPRHPLDAVEALQDAGVPAGRVLDTGEILDDPQLLRRGFWVYLPHPKMHRYKQQGIPWRFVEAAPRLHRHSPLFGEHTREVLTGLCGLTDADLDELAATGVIGDAPVDPVIG